MPADLLDGLARRLDADALGTYTPDGAISGEWPICTEAMPPEGPGIGLFPYPGAAQIGRAHV